MAHGGEGQGEFAFGLAVEAEDCLSAVDCGYGGEFGVGDVAAIIRMPELQPLADCERSALGSIDFRRVLPPGRTHFESPAIRSSHGEQLGATVHGLDREIAVVSNALALLVAGAGGMDDVACAVAAGI